MPTKIKNEDGTETEYLSPEEVSAKLQEKEKEVVGVWEPKVNEAKTQLSTALTEKQQIEEKLKSAGGPQSENFKTLKEALDKKDKEISDLNTKFETISQGSLNEHRDSIVSKFAGKDEDLKKKILHHFDETLKGVQAKSKEEISKKLESAIKLSVENIAPSVLQAAISGAGGPGFQSNSNNGPVEFSATEKGLGARMGITEDDYKKYGPRLKTKK